MTNRDEPLTDEPTQPGIEEISDDLIIEPGETLPGAVHAPGTEPSETSLTSAETALPPAPAPAPAAKPARTEPSRPVARATPATPSRPAAGPAPAPRAEERLDEASTRVVIVPRESAPRARFPLLVAVVFLFCGFGAGFFAGQLWERQGRIPGAAPSPPAPPAPTAAPEPGPGAAEPVRPEARDDERPDPPTAKRPTKAQAAKSAPKAAPAKPARSAAPASGDRAKLDVTAPAGAEVYLDGKRIGRGSTHTTVAPGRHRIEVRVGKNRVAESFDAEPGGTWTYDVTKK